jgi:NADH dehydrogenase
MTALKHRALGNAGHMTNDHPTRVLVIGGGSVGFYTAHRLMRGARPDEIDVTVVDPRSYMTYQPFLPESAAGNLSPRHVVVPLRTVLRGVRVLTGHIEAVDQARKVARFRPHDGAPYELSFDHLVVAIGSQPRTLPIPGLAEQGIGFQAVEEAIALRNHVISQLDVAASSPDTARRDGALTFCFVGGGYAGVEAIAELHDMARAALRFYPGITAGDMRWVLVEARDRIMPEVSLDMARYTVDQLRDAGIEVKLETRLASCVDGHLELSDGSVFDAATLVWTAGVRPNAMVRGYGLPLDEKGRVKVDAELRVDGLPAVWAAGDCAAVPDITGAPGALCGPTAQHAVRQAKHLARNILRYIRGEQPTPYRHKYAGSVASLGLHQGVAQVYGIKLKGWPAWFIHRTYHLSRIPTLNRKLRVVSEWTLALFFHREIASLGSLETPRAEFTAATKD